MTDALITRLGRSGQLLVRPTSAVMAYAGAKADATRSGRELSVDAVLEGKVQRAGDRVRVTAQLVRVSDGTTLWADTLDEPFTDLFQVQDALSSRLEKALALKMGGAAARTADKPTEDADAYRSYLRGRYFWNKLTGPWLSKALAEFRAAVGTTRASRARGPASRIRRSCWRCSASRRPRRAGPSRVKPPSGRWRSIRASPRRVCQSAT